MPFLLTNLLLCVLFGYLTMTMPHNAPRVVRWFTLVSTVGLIGLLIGTILPMAPRTVVNAPITIGFTVLLGVFAAFGNFVSRRKV